MQGLLATTGHHSACIDPTRAACNEVQEAGCGLPGLWVQTLALLRSAGPRGCGWEASVLGAGLGCGGGQCRHPISSLE